jgi:transcription elongation GreA/GreB family factor
MTRAFMKERDDAPEPRITTRRTSPFPVTASGLARLRAEAAATVDPAQRAALEEELLLAVVPPPPADPAVIDFGARVRVDSVGSPEMEFLIVGDDEADVKAGKIGVTSPLAVALLGKRSGGRAVWHRPVGDRQLRIRNVTYDL